MKRMVAGIVVGILIGSVAGRLALQLPPFWNVIFAFVLSLGISLWAIRSLRELDRRKRIIDEMLMRAAAVSVHELVARLAAADGAKDKPRPRKDLGLPLQ